MNAWQTAATDTVVVSTSPSESSASGLAFVAQVAERGEERRRVEERRQDRDEHDLRLQLDVRDARHEAEREPAEHEQDRVRHAQPRRKREQRRAGGEECEEEQRVVSRERHR